MFICIYFYMYSSDVHFDFFGFALISKYYGFSSDSRSFLRLQGRNVCSNILSLKLTISQSRSYSTHIPIVVYVCTLWYAVQYIGTYANHRLNIINKFNIRADSLHHRSRHHHDASRLTTIIFILYNLF